MSPFDIRRYSARVLILFLLLAVPVLRLVVLSEYGLLHVEVLVLVLLALGAAAGLAALGRRPVVFHALMVALCVALSLNAVRNDFVPGLRLRWTISVLALLLIAAVALLRLRFYPILAIFLAGSFGADLVKAAVSRTRDVLPAAPAAQSASNGRSHVFHLVLDEMIGLGGLPEDCGSCVKAREAFHGVLADGNFRIYPNAFSNYQATRDSLPSILNGRLLSRTKEYFSESDPRPYLHQNQYFARYRESGYALRIYQSDYLLYSAPEFGEAVARTYQSNSLKTLHHLRMPWTARLRQLALFFVQADHSWWGGITRVVPESKLPELLRVAPLAAREVWPDPVLADARAADRNTLFFAHLLTPHYPSMYRADGSFRNPQEWRPHSQLEFYEGEAAEYRRRYEMYGEQVQYLARDLRAFFDALRAAGLYDSSTIVVHGDHGSRLRLLRESERQQRRRLQTTTADCDGVNRYDYPGDPELRDLLDRFSTLFAIKPPGAAAPEVITEKGSVLYFLRRFGGAVDSGAGAEALNSVYLFRADGSPQAIPLLKYWSTNGESAPLSRNKL